MTDSIATHRPLSMHNVPERPPIEEPPTQVPPFEPPTRPPEEPPPIDVPPYPAPNPVEQPPPEQDRGALAAYCRSSQAHQEYVS